jgi:Cd2+/Zn2+-exporting ATPase
MKGIELFDEFFESGLEESVSPFLRPRSRKWGHNLHLKSAVLAAFFLFAALLFSLFPETNHLHPLTNLCLLFTYFFAGTPALILAVEDIFNLEINIDVLMTLAAFLAVIIGSSREGALLLVLFALSHAMEDAVRSKAKGAISALKQLAPQKAFAIQGDGSLIERSVKDIEVGSKIHVKAGQIIPLDGKVIEGATSVNLMHLTGEGLPQTRQVGDAVPAGARNMEGAISLEVSHTSSDSTLARIIQLIIQAQEAKPKLQRWLDRFSNLYAISIISFATLTALFFPLLFTIPYLGREGSIYRGLAFLIAASPCALIIAIPIAYLSAVSACAKEGILLKGGVILDALAKCKILALDKTGTITTGKLTCLGFKNFGSNPYPLEMAYSLERSAMHPIAHAIVAYAQQKGIRPLPIKDFVQVPGFGLQATFEDKDLYIGKGEWIVPKIPGHLRSEVVEEITLLSKKGETLTLLLYDGNLTLFRFQDTIRPGIQQTLKELQQEGMRIVMLTGDTRENAATMAQTAGIEEYHAALKPEDKLDYISQHPSLVMVGDGINDAPALARASVGISMGRGGSTTAIDASDIVLLQDNIELLAWLIKKSKQVVQIVRQNVILATGAIFFATIPALLGWIPLWLAVILHEGGTVLVGLNALRLLKRGKILHDKSRKEEIKGGRSARDSSF